MTNLIYNSLQILLLTFFTGVIPSQTFAQSSKKAEKKYIKARSLIKKDQYDKAVVFLNKAIRLDPSYSLAYLYRAGIYQNQKKFDLAVPDYQKSIDLSPDQDPKVYFTMGVCQRAIKKYSDASESFQQFLNKTDPDNNRYRLAIKYLETSKFTDDAIKNPVHFEPLRLSENINTNWPEYLPRITADGKIMIFTRRINGQEDFYLSVATDTGWSESAPIKGLNTKENEGAHSISADGRKIFFTRCEAEDSYGGCDIYFTQKIGDHWTIPENLGSQINSRFRDFQPHISADEQTLYFCSNRPRGLGKTDIWYSKRKHNGDWGPAMNMGEPINTAQEDESPFLHADGVSFYFMSKGHTGLGDFDLFMSRKDNNGYWQKPINLGYPINTAGNEGALFITLDGETAYFASDRGLDIEKGISNDRKTDIFQFQLPQKVKAQKVTYVNGTVVDAETKAGLSAEIYLYNLSLAKHYSIKSDKSGKFLITLPAGSNYNLTAENEGYIFYSENIDLSEARDIYHPYELEIKLQQIGISLTQPEKKPIRLDNIFFKSGSADLLQPSIIELDRLRGLLVNNPEIKIRIIGHTDNLGSTEDNQTLSENRAKSVYTWLLRQAISPDRLEYIGFGESMPIDTNDTPEGRRKNRRTEFLLLE
jgi:outer membrane protein OmpA-like peptidoglycan-associated protein